MPNKRPDRPGQEYPGWEGGTPMGGKPSKGTKRDRRLKRNKPRRESWIARKRRQWRAK